MLFTMRGVNPSPTKKFAVQLVTTATEVAIPRAPWVNNSVTKNQGIDPGPVANPTTKVMTMTIETYANVGTDSWNENYMKSRCLKILEKVSFNIASEASYVYTVYTH